MSRQIEISISTKTDMRIKSYCGQGIKRLVEGAAHQ